MPIPDKRYFTIGEVSQLCDVKPHVLRYWESEFSQLKPCKRRGNRRYYQRKDVLMVRKIRTLLYEQGYTIGGARQQLSLNLEVTDSSLMPLPVQPTAMADKNFHQIIQDLQEVLQDLTAVPGQNS